MSQIIVGLNVIGIQAESGAVLRALTVHIAFTLQCARLEDLGDGNIRVFPRRLRGATHCCHAKDQKTRPIQSRMMWFLSL
jgi:hypothetical protein